MREIDQCIFIAKKIDSQFNIRVNSILFMKNKFYQLWKNQRKIVIFVLFLSIFSFFLRAPFDKDAKIKDTCAKLNSSYQITGAEAMKKLNLKEIKNYNNRELANYYCERYLGIN